MAGGEPVSGRERPAGSSGEAAERSGSLQPQQLLAEIARLAADKKAIEIVELDLRGVLGYTDYFLICSGNTTRQTKAIHDGILEGLKREHGTLARRVEGASRADWILMDYLDVVVHIFTPQAREYYRLEQLWGEAPSRVADGG
ncbi:MAG: ribosome-associated protein [Solirubrobacteraceae bacterium]|jgi:ribosome-associated protein|nr:ribosome-associated protein [Solirubrobacteraceae bacterium]